MGIVSHEHGVMIRSNGCVAELAQTPGIRVVIKDNVCNGELRNYCLARGITYLDDCPGRGFGANNNQIFRFVQATYQIGATDYFVVMNPDVLVSPSTLIGFVEAIRSSNHYLATINLFRDKAMTLHDYSVRRFPSAFELVLSRVTGKTPSRYPKETLKVPTPVEWCSGAFMAFAVELFSSLCGFDERYFMYFEDADICRRARLEFGANTWYYPQFTAVHFAAHRNRRLLSPHFWWFLRSYFRLQTGK